MVDCGFQHQMTVAVAHQVEHWIVTPEVAGSRPVGHPTYPNPEKQLAQDEILRPSLCRWC